MASRSLRRRRQRRSKKTLMLLGMGVSLVLLAGGLAAAIFVFVIASDTPPLESLRSNDPGATSAIYAANGQRLGFIQANELRQPIPGDEIPETLKKATVAIEDERFYRHHGVDFFGVARAAVKNVTSQKTVQGGSTITMQLVRNLYISNERTYKRKIREAKLAQELENAHDKQWILNSYLNSVPFGTVGGQSAVGAEAGARMYFGKPAKKLTLSESALLAGLPQAPTTYSPVRAPEKAKKRRNEVLGKMAQLGMITEDTAARAMKDPVRIKPPSYFTKRRESYFFDFVKDELIKQYGMKRVLDGGLKIYTTIDLKKQSQARKAIATRLAGAGPSAAIVTIDPKNGYIRAMASSADYGQSKFNLAAQGHRQPGSTFKIMTLMTALREGVNPDSTYYVSRPFEIKNPPWKVKTYGNTYGGSMSLTRATLRSDNTVYAQLALDVGADKVKKTAEDMGITSPLLGVPAESLGGLEKGVSPLEMANAFATIASGGYRNRPTAITKVVFPSGRSELPKEFKVKRTRAFDDSVTAKATTILVDNIKGGTGRAANVGCPAGGKTGTTDSNNDAWFVGFTPRLATAVWVGYPDAQVQMNHEYHGGPVAGATFPAEIWGDYMKTAIGGYCGDFAKPKTKFVSKPFSGKYSKSGGSGYDYYDYQSNTTTTPNDTPNDDLPDAPDAPTRSKPKPAETANRPDPTGGVTADE